MSTNTKPETTIKANPDLPTIEIVREFDAPPERVFRAWTDPELFAKWVGPRNLTTKVDHWDCKTGGGYRYRNLRDGEEIASFFGSFHEVRTNERLVQTFTWEGQPDGVSLETMTFEALGDGRTRIVSLGVVESMEIRDMILSSGMDTGVVEGYEKLDELLAAQR
ncbi:uncharacterized protein YndB with AHSA1/START domain [Antricoccus suffuscus]|uniref:Uncharacterized protein YndB with AHSA1/START domain n=1 Tax=Antricoccus suffuscus TaxID=1629062 RepID=A0A2T1A2W4_9ACTN|nr:SRPBCC family protein [Antricoccus suffuscus]PRZ42874.1 uncharacterized protein YndB with AHSA1/START domain [Antricoccus suffuscus]